MPRWRQQRLSERHFLIPLAGRRRVDVFSILVRARNRFRFITVTCTMTHIVLVILPQFAKYEFRIIIHT